MAIKTFGWSAHIMAGFFSIILLYFKMISLNAYKIALWETILATEQNSLHHDLSGFNGAYLQFKVNYKCIYMLGLPGG